MWQEKMAVYLISWQFADGFHITKATIHIPNSSHSPVSPSIHPYHYSSKQRRVITFHPHLACRLEQTFVER